MWGDAAHFVLTDTVTVPSRRTLTSPHGPVLDQTPTFAWDSLAEASGYFLWVNDTATGVAVSNERLTATTFTPSSNSRTASTSTGSKPKTKPAAHERCSHLRSHRPGQRPLAIEMGNSVIGSLNRKRPATKFEFSLRILEYDVDFAHCQSHQAPNVKRLRVPEVLGSREFLIGVLNIHVA